MVEDEHRRSVTHEHQDAVKTTRSRRHGQDACVSTHAARSVRWCYLTGRCAYLPSVTCYRQSIKPLLLLLQVFYTWVARSRSGSSSFTASALNKPSSSSSSSLPPSLPLLLFPSSPFSVPCPSVPTLLFPPRCSGSSRPLCVPRHPGACLDQTAGREREREKERERRKTQGRKVRGRREREFIRKQVHNGGSWARSGDRRCFTLV